MTKLERVARAICRANAEDPDERASENGLLFWEIYRPDAQFAIDEVDAWEPICTVPKDGSTVIVLFKPHGPLTVFWHEDTWCVDDMKNGPYPLRGYRAKDATHWKKLPDLPK